MIIDCHTHINCPGCDISTEDHFAASEPVDACIVLACPSESNRQSSEIVARYAAKHPKKMFGFAVVNPAKDDISKRCWSGIKDDMNLKGAVLYCAGEGFHPAHSKALQFYEVAQDLKLPLFFHNAPPFTADAFLEYARPSLLDEIAQNFKGLKIVIGSIGLPFVNETICMLAKHENVFGDLTINPQKVWEVYNTVLVAHEADVLGKLFFGSGLPFGKPQNCIETLLGFNKLFADTNLPSVPREKIREIIERDSLAILGIEHTLNT
ncbi:MAG: amidohydrolase family protein [Sedimentisphaerales bacterium]